MIYNDVRRCARDISTERFIARVTFDLSEHQIWRDKEIFAFLSFEKFI